MANMFDNLRVSIGRSIIGKRLFGVGKEDDYFQFAEKFNSGSATYSYLDTYKGIVYACVSVLAERVGGYEPVIVRDTAKGEETLKTHPFLDLLDNPQPDNPAGISSFELIEATQSFIELCGEAFWYMVRGNVSGKPKSIYLLRPDKVGVSINDAGEVDGYFIRRNGMPSIPFEIEEILHFKMFNPKNPYRGMGTIQAALDFVETEDHSVNFTKNFFKNNAGVSGILSVKGEVTRNAFDKFARRWREKYEGVDNAGKVAIVRETDALFTKVGLGLDELDMKGLREMTKEDITTLFRVPLPLLGKAEGVGLGRGNVETLEYIFSKYAIEPRMDRIDAVLQRGLDRYYGTGLEIKHKNEVPEDKDYNAQVDRESVDVWQTRNEIRTKHGLEPIEGGDELLVALNQSPLSNLTVPATTSGKSVSIKIKKKDKEEVYTEINSDNKEQFRLSLMDNQMAYEAKYKKVLEPILREQQKETIVNLEAKATALKDFQEKLFDDAKADQIMQEKIIPVLESLSVEQGALAMVFAGDDTTEFTMTDLMRAFIEKSTANMASAFNDATLKALNDTLAVGVAEGESLSKLKKRVGEVYTKAKGYRAERIARTETLKASNSATEAAYKQLGYVKAKKWYANPGHCKICDSLNGDIINLDQNYAELGQNIEYIDEKGNPQKYAVDYDTVQNPPIHPNCRCTIVPVR